MPSLEGSYNIFPDEIIVEHQRISILTQTMVTWASSLCVTHPSETHSSFNQKNQSHVYIVVSRTCFTLNETLSCDHVHGNRESRKALTLIYPYLSTEYDH